MNMRNRESEVLMPLSSQYFLVKILRLRIHQLSMPGYIRCHYTSGLAHVWLYSGEVMVSWNKEQLPSLDCGGTGVMADIFGESSELHHVGSAFFLCLLACFMFCCLLLEKQPMSM